MKTFKEFRADWILDPSKEMIVETEIVSAYHRYKLNLLTDTPIKDEKTNYSG